MPHIVSGIHEAYLKSGADIIETCSFNATAISLAGYGLADFAYELSAAAARLARKAADAFSTTDKPRFVAGSMGPTAKSASIAPDLDDPGKRAVTWDELETAYYENARGLLDGGADIFLIETVFDTLNAKAAIFAVRRLAQERGLDLPLIISATVSDNGGRLLSGQSVEAFCVSVLHANPLALGLNCSFGAEKLKQYIAALSAVAPCLVSAYPNAGFPNSHGVYDETPESMADHLEEYMRGGLVNIVGGCCGSTPAHIAAIAARAEKYAPRPVPEPSPKTILAGLDVMEFNHGLANIAEHDTDALRREFNRLLKEGDYDGTVDLVRKTVEDGAAFIDVCIDENLPDAKAAVSCFLNLALQYPDIARLPVMLDSDFWEVIEAGLKCLQGKGLVNSACFKEGDAESNRRLALVRAYGAAAVLRFPQNKPLGAM
jgi:5-methyltetrahydrofolate--homocysteine methyltransferase